MLKTVKGQSGQTLIFMSIILVIIGVIALWNFDLHKIIWVKSKARNAGDAAALAAARWQSHSLNTIGNLNVMEAVALTVALSQGQTQFPAAEAIADTMNRVNVLGPMTGMSAAQQAAKNNGIFNNEAYAQELMEHASDIRATYDLAHVQPYAPITGSASTWDDIASMYETMATEGVAVQCDNATYNGDLSAGGHILLDPAFYNAISTRNWCWFYNDREHDAYGWLRNYTSYLSWPSLPIIDFDDPINSELFSLRLQRRTTLDQIALKNGGDTDDLLEMMNEFADIDVDTIPEIVEVEASWLVYGSAWTLWDERFADGFPIDGEIKDIFNYAGADSVVRLTAEATRLSPGASSDPISWNAAAKPFGWLDSPQGRVRPDSYGIVLPAFHEVRLIPVGGSSAPARGDVKPGWAAFVRVWLPIYMSRGPNALPWNNFYCAQLKVWEDPRFRADGVEYLQLNSGNCYDPPPQGGGGSSGGATQAH